MPRNGNGNGNGNGDWISNESDLDKYPTPDIRRNMGGSSTPPEESIPASVSVTPPSTLAAIEAAQNSGITGTPQRRGNPAENESGIFGGNRLPPRTPPPRQPARGVGVDYFNNEKVKGFVTNTHFQQTDHIDPLRESMNYKDSKGDFNYFQNNPSKKFGGTISQLLDFRGDAVIPGFNWVGLDRSGFVSMFNQDNLFTTKFEGSRLEDVGNSGFFDGYYSQLFSKSGLGIQSDNHSQNRNVGFSGYLTPQLKKTNFGINKIRQYVLGSPGDSNPLPSFVVPKDREEPFIIRGIGQRWGIDRIPKPDIAGSPAVGGLVRIDKPAYSGGAVAQSFVNAIDDIQSNIIGRQPSVFADRYFADVYRINGATNSLDFFTRGSTFVNAQAKLQKRNPFDVISTTLYNLSDDGQMSIGTGDIVPNNVAKLSKELGYNANEDVLKLNLDPKSYNPLSVFSVPGVMGINRNSYLDISGIVAEGTIKDFISDKVMDTIKSSLQDQLKARWKEASAKIAERAADKAKKKFGKKIRKVTGVDEIKKARKKYVEKKQKARARVEGIVDGAEKFLKGVKKTAQWFELIPGEEGANVSKAKLTVLNKEAFSDKGADRVNLIPYGKDKFKIGDNEIPVEELDWIPFKFKDVRNGKFITFRAILSGITDTFSPQFNPERYVGRPDNVHVYTGTDREIAFTFEIYPKSDTEMLTLWEKLNYLAGLTYPHWTNPDSHGGRGMIAPFSELTIGQLYSETPGFINTLTYTVMDESTWETSFAKLPKYIQVECTFTHIGKRLPDAVGKHFEAPWIGYTEKMEWMNENLDVEDPNLNLSPDRLSNGEIDPTKFNKMLSDVGL